MKIRLHVDSQLTIETRKEKEKAKPSQNKNSKERKGAYT
jgi:hypothetical protein